jgi:Fe-S-cluster containining protein
VSLGCAECGDCCDPVGMSGRVRGVIQRWQAWENAGGNRDEAENCDPSVWFAIDRWAPILGPMGERSIAEDPEFRNHRCDMFDTTTRLCTAYEGRPPVCSGFPWYGEAQTPEHIAVLPSRCSYALDVLVASRRRDSKPLIPLRVIR